MIYAKKLEYYQHLYTHYQGMMFRVCRIYGQGDEEFMRDLYQDISLALWESLDHFECRSQESTWVWNVAQKTARYRLRKRMTESAWVQTGLPEGVEEAIADTPPPDEEESDIEQLYKAIAQLDADDQLLVTLRLEAKSYAEIAAQMGLQEGALRTRFNRIVQQLRQLMESPR